MRAVRGFAERIAPEEDAASEDIVEDRCRDLLLSLGLDLSEPNLKDTPGRMARSLRELLSGLSPENAPVLRTFPNPAGHRDAVVLRGIPFQSLCAHHLLPFFGHADVSYLPGDQVLGLSKLARVVDYCARRPQLQERLGVEIADEIEKRLRPRGVKVRLRARHLCMEMRGVQKAGIVTTTTARRGAFLRPAPAWEVEN
jgi:GTP cyclohydrolase I